MILLKRALPASLPRERAAAAEEAAGRTVAGKGDRHTTPSAVAASQQRASGQDHGGAQRGDLAANLLARPRFPPVTSEMVSIRLIVTDVCLGDAIPQAPWHECAGSRPACDTVAEVAGMCGGREGVA